MARADVDPANLGTPVRPHGYHAIKSTPFAFHSIQFPVRPAFDMTVNKSQGQTLEKVGIFLPKDLFSHGQLYFAMPRDGAGNRICIQVLGGGRQGHDGVFTRNIVYPEALL